MTALQTILAVISLAVTVVAVVLVARTVVHLVRMIRLGQPDHTRTNDPAVRLANMLREIFGHTRMLKLTPVGIAHWFVMLGFLVLSLVIPEAYGEVFDPEFELPLIGSWWLWNLVVEGLGITTVLGILGLMAIRQINHPRNPLRKSRFAGSNFGQAYFVEIVVLIEGLGVLTVRGFKSAAGYLHAPEWSAPISNLLGDILPASDAAIQITATIKVLSAMIWLIVIAMNPNMGIAWHRFTAFFNVFFKRHARGQVSLRALQPMKSNGEVLDFEEADPEKDLFGVSQVEHFGWKGILDFTTCTECGRCQSQCPAWNTGKPLSPKLLILSLRDNMVSKAPYLLAGGGKDLAGEEKGTEEQLAGVPATALAEAERPLIGDLSMNGVIDPDILWSCTTCGACVEQCPVDIEHVDHIVDMRRYQVLIESSFPSEAGVMLKNLESKGNPWGLAAKARDEWMEGLDFEVPRIEGEIPEDVEYLFWVGCAGSLEDRAKKVTRAVAELLHIADVKFAVLGSDETCTGDPARRLGNEFVFQGLAQQNVEVLNAVFENRPERTQRKIVATCPHCFNTLSNEYPQLGGEYDVVHHTQLLGRLVEEQRLVPVQPVEGLVTYHDPCYLGRHNKVYTPPREVLDSVQGIRTEEMHRCKERGFCCGAGGARMWMEERIGKRINAERVDEALSLDPDIVSTACPFCITMLTDAVTSKQQSGDAREEIEVLDVSQILRRSLQDTPAEEPAPTA